MPRALVTDQSARGVVTSLLTAGSVFELSVDITFCFVSSETKRYCFQFRGELFT